MTFSLINFISQDVSTFIAGLSFITCSIMICYYRKLKQKSVFMNIIFCICLFDFLFELLTGLWILFPTHSQISEILAIIVGIIFLSSLLTATSMARISYKTLTADIYDPNRDFFLSIIIIFLFTSLFILVPLTDNGIIMYQSFASMGFYKSVKDENFLIAFVAFAYINLPCLVSLGITLYCYYSINQMFSANMKLYGKMDNSRVNYLYVYVLWQFFLLLPLVIISNFTLIGHNPPDWILFIDVIFTRSAGLVNCCIYFFIRVKKPDMLRSTSAITKNYTNLRNPEIFLAESVIEPSGNPEMNYL